MKFSKTRIRYPIEYQVLIEKKTDKSPVSLLAKTSNISLTGVGVELPEDSLLKAGDRVQISFHFESEALPLDARVIWRNGIFCGIEIVERDVLKRQYFTSLVDACEAYLYFRPENSKPKIVA